MRIVKGCKLHTLVVALLVPIGVQLSTLHVEAHGNTPADIDALIHAAATYRGASYWLMRNVLECESDHWDRRVIAGAKKGRDGEVGIAQIHPRGLGPLFESRGGDYSASDSIYFLAWATTHGLRHHWSC